MCPAPPRRPPATQWVSSDLAPVPGPGLGEGHVPQPCPCPLPPPHTRWLHPHLELQLHLKITVSILDLSPELHTTDPNASGTSLSRYPYKLKTSANELIFSLKLLHSPVFSIPVNGTLKCPQKNLIQA